MFNGDCTNISTLPPEVLQHIFLNLSYPCLQSIRPTCKAFNAVATELLCDRLHRIRLQVDKVAVKFIQASWLKTSHVGAAAVLTYAKRLAKGAGSLVILAGLVRAADVCSRQFVLVGALPPLPATVLEDIVTAVQKATWRNPLIGVLRLHIMYNNLMAYFRHNRVLNAKGLPPAVMFRTVLDVIQNMPRLTSSHQLEQKYEGVVCSCTLPPIRINLQPQGKEVTGDTDDLLFKLMQLSMNVVERYTVTRQSQRVIGEDPVSEHEGYIKHIQLMVPCGVLQDLSIKLLRELEPPAFFVTLSGFKVTTQQDLDDLEAKEEIHLDYSFCKFFCLQ